MNSTITTIKKELRGIIRDKKTLFIMLLTPLLIPLFVIFMSYIYNNMDNKIEYKIGINYNYNDTEKQIIDRLGLSTIYYETKDELNKAYEDGIINAYVIREGNNYNIYVNENNQDSSLASNTFTMYLDEMNNYMAQNYLNSINADINKVYHNINYTYTNLEGKNDFTNSIISSAFIFGIMAITLVATYCATDSTAGEKERGTLETFLTFPIKSKDIVKGKYLAITISCIITSIISIILSISSLKICQNMFDIYKDSTFNFNIITISLGFLIMIIYSIFISGLCIAIASMSKSYKEAQSSLTPISMLTIIPMFIEFITPNITIALSSIPIINHVLLLKSVFCDKLDSSSLTNIGVMIISTLIITIIIIKYISKQYKSEKILF